MCGKQCVWFCRDCLTAGAYGYDFVHETVAALRYVYGAEYCANMFDLLHFLKNFFFFFFNIFIQAKTCNVVYNLQT